MNLEKFNNEITMSSREIAELTGKQHKNVIADCRKLIDEYEKLFINQSAEISALIKSTTYEDRNSSIQPCFELSRQATIDLMTGYSLPMRHAINKRWLELESKNSLSLPNFNDPAAAARAWASEYEAKQAALQQIEADKPKVEFAMAVRNMQGACSVGDFAKTLGTGRNRFFAWLREIGALMINNMPYQHHIDRGLFVVIEQLPYTDSSGKDHPAFKTLITGKGQIWLEKKFRTTQDVKPYGLKKIAQIA